MYYNSIYNSYIFDDLETTETDFQLEEALAVGPGKHSFENVDDRVHVGHLNDGSAQNGGRQNLWHNAISSSGPRLKGRALGGSNLISHDFLLTFSLLSIKKLCVKTLK